jgi:hypothetical protein
MDQAIAFILGNFTLTFFVVGLIASGTALVRHDGPRTAAVTLEALFAYFLLFSIGFAYVYNFIMHVFFHEMTASLIGWADSPFQLEVGFASLGFGIVGLLAFKGSFGLRTAAILGPSCFLLGAAGVHVYDIVTAGNFAPGNAGVILYSDIGVPVLGLVMLWLQHRFAAGRTSPHMLSPLV